MKFAAKVAFVFSRANAACIKCTVFNALFIRNVEGKAFPRAEAAL